MTARSITRRANELERAIPPPDISKLTDTELEAAVMSEMVAYRAAELRALADPSSTLVRRTRAVNALRVVAEVLA